MKIWNTSRELIEWLDHHHVPMHENGGVDEINLGGLSGEPADTVNKSLFDAQTVIHATSDDTPVALTVTEQTVVGRLTGGNISAVAIGIANDNILQVEHTSPADNDYAKFTAAGIEGREYGEVVTDLTSDLDTWLAAKEADYAPSAWSVDTGSLIAGSYTDLAALGGTDVQIEEASGADPLRVTLTFSSVTLTPNNVLIFGNYVGGAGHYIACEIYNNDTTSWDMIGRLDDEDAKRWYSFPVFNGDAYVDGSDDVQVRLRHVQNGVTAHDLYLDYFVVQKTFGAGGGIGAVLDSPVDGEANVAISANWAYDHINDADTHTNYILHSLADAANDFLVASGNDAFAKQTAAQVLATLSGEAGAAFSFNSQGITNVNYLFGQTDAILILDARRASGTDAIAFRSEGGTKWLMQRNGNLVAQGAYNLYPSVDGNGQFGLVGNRLGFVYNIWNIGSQATISNYTEYTEHAAPGAGAANTARVYAVENGAKTDLYAVFQAGAAVLIAAEPTPADSPILTESDGTEVKIVLRKPHPGIIRHVAEYPNGKTHILQEIHYHDADKIASNVGYDNPLPEDWFVETKAERRARVKREQPKGE